RRGEGVAEGEPVKSQGLEAGEGGYQGLDAGIRGGAQDQRFVGGEVRPDGGIVGEDLAVDRLEGAVRAEQQLPGRRRGRGGAGYGGRQVELPFPGEGRGQHEEHQQDEDHVDQGGEAKGAAPGFGSEGCGHGQAFWARPCLRASTPRRSAWAVRMRPMSSVMRAAMFSTWRSKALLKRLVGIATARPTAVVSRATQMPSDRVAGLTWLPAAAMALKASIMPSTVPNRPSSGASTAITSRIRSRLPRPLRWPRATRVISSRMSSTVSQGLSKRRRPRATTSALGLR